MPHIHTEPDQHDHTVAAYIFRLDGHEPRALMHMHKKMDILICAGGHVELNESPWDAVLHEVREETGYAPEQLTLLQPPLRITQHGIDDVTIHPQPLFSDTHMSLPGHWHTDQVYLFTVDTDPLHELGEGESIDVRWLSRDDVAALVDGEIFPNVRTTHLAAFDQFLDAWEPLPATSYRTDKIVKK